MHEPEPCQFCGHPSASPIHSTTGLHWLCNVCVDIPEALPEDVYTCDHCHSQKLESCFASVWWRDERVCIECHDNMSPSYYPDWDLERKDLEMEEQQYA